MTTKQMLFCDEYLTDLNATQAAIRAGCSKKAARQIGQQLLSKLDTKEYIENRMKEKESELIATQDEVLKYLSAVMRGTSSSSVLARDEIGADKIIEKPPDEKEKLKAAELLAKRYGILSDKVNIEGSVPVVISGDERLED